MMAAAEVIELLRQIARKHGWALATHGSMRRDIDLIGVPWVDDAADWYVLFCAMREAVGKELGGFAQKPHGRVAFILLQNGATVDNERSAADGYKAHWVPQALDISLIDPRKTRTAA